MTTTTTTTTTTSGPAPAPFPQSIDRDLLPHNGRDLPGADAVGEYVYAWDTIYSRVRLGVLQNVDRDKVHPYRVTIVEAGTGRPSHTSWYQRATPAMEAYQHHPDFAYMGLDQPGLVNNADETPDPADDLEPDDLAPAEFREYGEHLEQLGRALQDGGTTVRELVDLCHAAGFDLGIRLRFDGGEVER